jgi:hypothetical protein
MLTQQTLERLHELRLPGMAQAFGVAMRKRMFCLPATRLRSAGVSRSTFHSARAPMAWMVSIRRSTRASVIWPPRRYAFAASQVTAHQLRVPP